VIATQVAGARRRTGARLPLVLMNSRGTRAPSLAVLADAGDQDVPRDFLQGREPKLDAATGGPVDWPADPELEWCPPGHGDLYVSIADSGMLDALLGQGYEWAFVSNADNLGAVFDPRIAAHAEARGAPFAMEVVRGTAADRKGGHLARHRGRVVLRETAQVPEGDDSFTDVGRWRFYNTNNLWLDLRALAALHAERPGEPRLPLIVNRKTVDPRDPSSPEVLQLETAMGAAIGALDGAVAVLVPRERFAPVKTTDDLLVVRSDAYELAGDGRMVPAFDGDGPVVELSPEFRTVEALEARFPHGPPSLKGCRRLVIDGDVSF
jgi:UTP--glucose-1-phosphate uridylyltransferase